MGSGGPLLIEHFHDDPVELFCDLVQLGPVACAGGSGGFVCPVLQCLCHCPWPAEVGTLRPGCERLRDGRHHLDLSVCAKSSAELVCGDLLQRRRERLHEVRGERTVDHCPKGRVFRGVHAVRHRHVHGDAAAEGGVVGNGFHYVIVARQRPAERLTAGDRTAFAEVVVRRALVVLNLLVARVPVPAQIMARPPGVAAHRSLDPIKRQRSAPTCNLQLGFALISAVQATAALQDDNPPPAGGR